MASARGSRAPGVSPKGRAMVVRNVTLSGLQATCQFLERNVREMAEQSRRGWSRAAHAQGRSHDARDSRNRFASKHAHSHSLSPRRMRMRAAGCSRVASSVSPPLRAATPAGRGRRARHVASGAVIACATAMATPDSTSTDAPSAARAELARGLDAARLAPQAAAPRRRSSTWPPARSTPPSRARDRLGEHTPYNHYALLADAWLHGRQDLAARPSALRA